MSHIVFLIGHPATGKSTLYSIITSKFKQSGQRFCRLNDRDFFQNLIAHDENHKFHRIETDGSITVTNPKLFELLFVNFGKKLQSTSWSEDWVFAELTSNNYPKTFHLMGEAFLSSCFVILVMASQETANTRNNNRPLHSENIDNEHIPDYYIRECYSQDMQHIPDFFRMAFLVVNDGNDLLNLEKSAEKIVMSLIESQNSKV